MGKLDASQHDGKDYRRRSNSKLIGHGQAMSISFEMLLHEAYGIVKQNSAPERSEGLFLARAAADAGAVPYFVSSVSCWPPPPPPPAPSQYKDYANYLKIIYLKKINSSYVTCICCLSARQRYLSANSAEGFLPSSYRPSPVQTPSGIPLASWQTQILVVSLNTIMDPGEMANCPHL